MMKRFMVASAIALAVLAALATGAWAEVNVTGTWNGKATCKGFFLGQPFTEVFTDENLGITRDGGDLHVVAFGFTYNGKIIDDADSVKKAEAGMILCGTEAEPFPEGVAEIARLKFTVNSATSASFKATSIFTVGGASPDVASCTWTFKRTSTDDPSVGGCPR